MNASTLVLRALIGAGLALTVAGMAVGSVEAQEPGDPTIATRGQTSIVTDKDTYAVGEPVTITYTLPSPGRYRITDRQGGRVSTLRSGYSGQATGRIQGTVTPPAGKECLHLEYWGSGQATSAETCFQVTDKGKEQAPAPGLYTLRNRDTGLMLESNLDKQIYGHAANDGAFQKWVLEAGPDGYFFLRDLATGYYLDDTSPIGRVSTLEKNLGIYQQWKFVPGREGSLLVINRETGRGLQAIMQGVYSNDDYPTVPDPYEWTLTAAQP